MTSSSPAWDSRMTLIFHPFKESDLPHGEPHRQDEHSCGCPRDVERPNESLLPGRWDAGEDATRYRSCLYTHAVPPAQDFSPNCGCSAAQMGDFPRVEAVAMDI